MTSLRRSSALALLLASLAGCPGYLDNPERFVGGSADSGLQSCLIGVDNVEAQLLRPRCATANCHDRGGRSGGLDLESPGLAARLLGVASRCRGQSLLVPGAGAGHLVDKLGATPGCGDRMPLGAPPLSAADVTCVRLWAAGLRLDAGAPLDVPAPIDAPARDVPVDTAADARPMDAVSDRPVDAALDAALDARVDARVDAVDEAPADASPLDVADASIDAAPDDAVDARDDAALDATLDAAAVDAVADTTPDAGAPRDAGVQ